MEDQVHHENVAAETTEYEKPELFQNLGAKVETSTQKELAADKLRASEREVTYMHGPRLVLTFVGILFCAFLVNVEISIVSTSLVTIANDFDSFDQVTWVVTAYQVTYTCLHMVWGKISDIFGRKGPLILALLIFIVFSGACGASQSISQLIILRAFQGAGASGVFLVSTVMIYEIVPEEKLPVFGGLAFAIVALATVIGPLLGGAIDTSASWRWIFLFNVPVGFVAFLTLFIAMPAKFPYHMEMEEPFWPITFPKRSAASPSISNKFWSLLKKMDCVGGVLVLAASFTLVTPLLQVSIIFQWSSPVTISLLVLSGLLWTSFFTWEWYLSSGKISREQEPIFPWRFVHNRPFLGILLTAFLVGIPMMALSIQLPERSQDVNEDSPFQAGLHLLAFSLAVPFGSFVGNGLAATLKQPAIIFIFAGSAIELVGASLLATVPSTIHIPHTMYGYEILTGFGAGLVFSSLMLVTPKSVESRDLATATSCFIQIRMLGSTIGVALTGSVVNQYLIAHLTSVLSPAQLSALLRDSTASLKFDESLSLLIRQVFGDAYILILKIILGVAVAQALSVALIWKQPQLRLH